MSSEVRRPARGQLDYFLGLRSRTDLAVIHADANAALAQAIAEKRPAALLLSGEAVDPLLIAAARKAGMSVLGPDSFGVIAPHAGIHHSLWPQPLLPGKVAFLTHGGSLGTAILDWATSQRLGFSAFVSLGRSSSISFGECIDYLAEDFHTQSILIYLEAIEQPAQFLSAARECALRKPIILLKAGRGDADSNAVYDAVFRRCGVLRVNRMADLFYMAEVLNRQPRPEGPRLAIVTNAHGPALLASDALATAGGELDGIDEIEPDASPEVFLAACRQALSRPTADGLLTIATPQPNAPLEQWAEALSRASQNTRKPVYAAFMGGDLVRNAHAVLDRLNIPSFPYADTAAKSFQKLWRYSTNLKGLYETPLFDSVLPGSPTVASELRAARTQGVERLPAEMAERLLAAYGISVLTASPEPLLRFHLRLDQHAVFGPVLFLSAAGLGETLYGDSVAGLPPLNTTLARRMLELVAAHRALDPELLPQLELLLVRFSRLASELPIIARARVTLTAMGAALASTEPEIDLHPLSLPESRWPRCTIRPYPLEYMETIRLRDGTSATLRPIRPEDESRMTSFHADLSERTVYLRYMQFLKEEERILHDRLVRVCFNDYARELALVVEQGEEILGVGRMQRNPLRMEEAEVAFLVRDSAQGKGIGGALLGKLLTIAAREGLERLTAELLPENTPMRRLLERYGFRSRLASDGQTLFASYPVPPLPPAPAGA